jgi:hypothetical protein
MNLLGKILATALLGLEEAGIGLSNPATAPQDITTFVSGIIQIWGLSAAAPQAQTAQLKRAA